jgi:hypothetical protein
MAKYAVRHRCFAIFLALLLPACATRPAILDEGPRQVELRDTPFFPQDRFQCGPAALATVLVASGVTVSPEELTPRVYLPERRGSLQVEMQAVPRSHGRLTLRLPRIIQAITAELDAGRPVLVLHNYGFAFWPRWHYAVVVGYDATRDRFLLRSGRERRQEMRARSFMLAWHNGGRWAMVVLRPGETAANDDPRAFLESAADFERNATPELARAAFDAAVMRWPAEPVALIGRGTAEYRLGNFAGAVRDYAAALALDASQIGARNNLAQALLDWGCAAAARRQLVSVDLTSLQAPFREAVSDTLAKAAAAENAGRSPAHCPAFP